MIKQIKYYKISIPKALEQVKTLTAVFNEAIKSIKVFRRAISQFEASLLLIHSTVSGYLNVYEIYRIRENIKRQQRMNEPNFFKRVLMWFND